MKLPGSRVLLTGASGGLGQALALALSAAGAELVLTARRAAVLDELAARTGGRVIAADLAVAAEVDRLAEEAGPVDVLLANAGLPGSGRLESYDSSGIDRVVDVNLRAPIQLTRALLPGMLERRRGHIVLVSSLAGLAASPESSLYAATKFGLRGFGLALRQDLAGTGVGVSVVLPGFISEAGMYADAGVRLPPGVGTRSPAELADATLGAIERDVAEVTVAPLPLAAGAYLGGLLPGPAGRVQRLLGGARTAANLAAAQREKR